MSKLQVTTFARLPALKLGKPHFITNLKTFVLCHPDNVREIPYVAQLRPLLTDEQAAKLIAGDLSDVTVLGAVRGSLDE